MDYATQYLSGDCQAVRDALTATIDADSSSEQLEVATVVADEFVTRCISNLSRIYDALLELRYEFAEPDIAFVLHESPDEVCVADFEREMGKMPLLASRWYRRIKSLNFGQTYAQMTDRASPLAGLGWGVLLRVQSLCRAKENWEQLRAEHADDDRQRTDADDDEPIAGPLAPALLTGGFASNCSCKFLQLPSFRFDDVLYNDGGGDQYFGDEIAHSFRRRGFPILSARRGTLRAVERMYGLPDLQYVSTRLPDTLAEV